MAEEKSEAKKNWIPDDDVTSCLICTEDFTMFRRKHHCRNCGQVFCNDCSSKKAELPASTGLKGPQRVCDSCFLILFNRDDNLESEVLAVRFQLRQTSTYQYIKPLLGIGFRRTPEKFTHLCRSDKKTEFILTVIRPGPHTGTVASESNSKLAKMLKSFVHPFVLPTVHAEFNRERQQLFVIRPFCSRGSIRDILNSSSPKNPASAKYIKGDVETFKEATISQYGRHLLEAMTFFRNKGFPNTFIHCGNLLLDNGVARVSDYENSILGLAPQLPPYIAAKASANPKIDVDVLIFGNVIYEMAFGMPVPQELDWHQLARTVPSRPILDLLTSIFKDVEPPSFQNIIKNNLFAELTVRIDAKYLTLSQNPENHGKTMIKQAAANLPKVLSDRAGMPFEAFIQTPGIVPQANAAQSSSSPPPSIPEDKPIERPRQAENINELYKDEKREKRLSTTGKRSTKKIGVPFSQSSSSLQVEASPPVSPRRRSTSSASIAVASASSPPPPPPPQSAAPPPPPPPPPPFNPSGGQSPPPPPPPPPPAAVAAPDAQPGRSALLDSIRNPSNLKKLKKVGK